MSNIDAEGRVVATSVSEMDKLDEAIKWARDMAYAGFENLSLVEEQRFENIANWLEELKEMWKSQGQVGDFWYSKGYTKAIQDFAESLKEKYEEHNFDLCLRQNDYYSYSNSCMLFESYIDEIAERMKAGGVE